MNKTSVEKHYKDREPLETVKLIIKFFKDNHYHIETERIQSASGTEGYHLELYSNNLKCLESNGKGVDADYALASAYAELYERFCNKNRIYGNPYFTSILQSYNYEHYGYYLAADEVITSFEDLYPDNNFREYFKIYFNNDNEYLYKFTNLICNNNFVTLPYHNLLNNKILHINPNILLHLQSTNGMTAGNTLEEALNHGISEIIERWCVKLFNDNLDKTYYQLNTDLIDNENLKTIIKKIKEDDNTLYIFDLSYSFDYPVIAAVIFNHRSKNISMRFGCFPVFDIALERTLTELYQNISSWKSSNYSVHLQKPFKLVRKGEFLDQLFTSGIQDIFPEHIINNIKQVDTFNSEIFLSHIQYSNEEILDYYKQLCEKKNISFYFRDCSLIKEMYAISMYSPELMTQQYFDINFINNISTEVKKESFDILVKLQNSFYNEKKLSCEDLQYLNMSVEHIQMFQLFTREHLIFLPFLEIDDFQYRIDILKTLLSFYEMKFDDEHIMDLFNDTALQSVVNKYLLLIRYVFSVYPFEAVKIIFEQFGENITKQDYINANNPHYILNKILINEYFDSRNILYILNGYFKEDVCDTRGL